MNTVEGCLILSPYIDRDGREGRADCDGCSSGVSDTVFVCRPWGERREWDESEHPVITTTRIFSKNIVRLWGNTDLEQSATTKLAMFIFK